ncbi:MAG: WbqC family protein [Deltaproteobacteria bacterium]|nr:WbqC family protein [Deltaproteobacteria bacterium]
MKVAIMQPYLFPYIPYWQLIHSVDVFVVYDDVNYIVRGFINRNYILERGKPKIFTLHTQGASQNIIINQVSVGGNAEKLINFFYHNYKKAPYFNSTMNILSELLLNKETNLSRFITTILKKICSYLSINTKFIDSSEVFNNANRRETDRIVDICRQLDAEVYINPIGGRVLYSKDEFAEKGIQIFFIESNPVVYKQFENLFVPNLSIIDVMMFNSPEAIHEFVESYRLV